MAYRCALLIALFLLFIARTPTAAAPAQTAAARPATAGNPAGDDKWRELLSKPDHEVRTLIDVKVPMRDGIRLSANIFLPHEPGRWPVIVERSPYGAKTSEWYVSRAMYYAKRGYAYVLQDVRGRYDSEGEWHPWAQEINDGRDTLDWSGTQPWSNGKVGMVGMSYMGLVQWLAAPTGSPYLKTIIPQACSADFYMYGMNYTGGASMHYINLPWAMATSARTMQSRLPYNLDKLERLLPILTADEIVTGRSINFYREWMLLSTYDDYWKRFSNFGKFQKMNLPILQVVGWLDIHSKSLFANYEGIQREGTQLAIREQKVIVGPWIHTDKPIQKYGDLDFGPDSVIDLYEVYLSWMDHWLKGVDNGADKQPPLRLFMMGANKWRTAEKWPLPDTKWNRLYLHSDGRANSLYGDGKLTWEAADKAERTDNYTYNPEDPVPTLGSDPNGQLLPVDYRPVE